MKLVRWKRFTWDLSKLPPEHDVHLPSYYTVRSASRDEEKAVRSVIFTAFGSDSAWGDSFKQVQSFIESQLNTSFLHRTVPCLVITLGVRVIAASALNAGDDAHTHLISGPCVLSEYRNRGLGTALLHESLAYLKTAGLDRGHGICKEHVPASKFVYPKFGSTMIDYDFDALEASL
jgi:GNAT superfamily N-acetyltransferase